VIGKLRGLSQGPLKEEGGEKTAFDLIQGIGKGNFTHLGRRGDKTDGHPGYKTEKKTGSSGLARE